VQIEPSKKIQFAFRDVGRHPRRMIFVTHQMTDHRELPTYAPACLS
jgi:hypothetical protein